MVLAISRTKHHQDIITGNKTELFCYHINLGCAMLPALCVVLVVHLRQDLVELRWYGRGEVKRIGGMK